MTLKPVFSIIIPVRVVTPYLKETLLKIKHQTFSNYEVLVITDKISHNPNPAYKRNLGAKKSKGKYLAFIDDDSYPDKDWLNNALTILEKTHFAAVCGPCLTPPSDSIYQKASGLVWSSYLGSGGAGTYRNLVSSPRFVDDYPSVNLIVRKDCFLKVNGFDTYHWPGEDTILCLNLVYKLQQKIYYHPSILVYHHRRPVIIPHLKQITRYALHRGYFARVYPKTSLKIGYFIPSFFVIYLIFFTPYSFPLFLYILLLLITFFQFLSKNSIITSFYATITIPLTHIYYGVIFLIGLFLPKLKYSAHEVDQSQQKYLGG